MLCLPTWAACPVCLVVLTVPGGGGKPTGSVPLQADPIRGPQPSCQPGARGICTRLPSCILERRGGGEGEGRPGVGAGQEDGNPARLDTNPGCLEQPVGEAVHPGLEMPQVSPFPAGQRQCVTAALCPWPAAPSSQHCSGLFPGPPDARGVVVRPPAPLLSPRSPSIFLCLLHLAEGGLPSSRTTASSEGTCLSCCRPSFYPRRRVDAAQTLAYLCE